MKKILFFAVFVLFNLHGFSQEVFQYEFDENLTIDVVEEAEEGELLDGKFVKGAFGNEIIVYLSSDKPKDIFKGKDEKKKVNFFKGVKDGLLKSAKGKLVSEEEFVLNDVKIYSFTIDFVAGGESKRTQSFNFFYKGFIYTIQFMNAQDEFEKNNDFRKKILDSIEFN
ncbi:hypothetical protein GOQ30_00350 [Flavobacterium sp. TP390]|uniref:PsbP C-terminal domain-containing protein n=1 Tax=Flavobacterium profundi TaxID=1774945 RepID=A0A6I4IDG7_9FLAO|nr:hypothetical protein [Flavobacterium profundi]MVO07608.1 hypothetical protein [Flavobacterium profundi]